MGVALPSRSISIWKEVWSMEREEQEERVERGDTDLDTPAEELHKQQQQQESLSI